MTNPHDVTKAFEADLCKFTGARYAVAVNSCTMAILLACAWFRRRYHPIIVSIPRRTYVSVPQAIIHAGHSVSFRDENWQGEYQLRGLPVFDSARRFRAGMHRLGDFQCVSFHQSKILSGTQGGAILHDDQEADAWLRRARFDGRTEGVPPAEDNFDMIGFHCYLSPDTAALLRWKLSTLPRDNPDLPNSDYPDLSKFPVFTQAASETLA